MPKKVRDKIFATVYQKADAFGYMECARVQSGQFMDLLVEDPDVGLILNEYMPKERVRTYIKDTILNQYTKQVNNRALAAMPPENTIKEVYGVTAAVIDNITSKGNVLSILRSEEGNIYVVSSGTVLKWETALRKALEIIAGKPTLTINDKAPYVCLKLSTPTQALTDADKKLIQSALGAVGVKAVFL
jgi:hypothetical protein